MSAPPECNVDIASLQCPHCTLRAQAAPPVDTATALSLCHYLPYAISPLRRTSLLLLEHDLYHVNCALAERVSR